MQNNKPNDNVKREMCTEYLINLLQNQRTFNERRKIRTTKISKNSALEQNIGEQDNIPPPVLTPKKSRHPLPDLTQTKSSKQTEVLVEADTASVEEVDIAPVATTQTITFRENLKRTVKKNYRKVII